MVRAEMFLTERALTCRAPANSAFLDVQARRTTENEVRDKTGT